MLFSRFLANFLASFWNSWSLRRNISICHHLFPCSGRPGFEILVLTKLWSVFIGEGDMFHSLEGLRIFVVAYMQSIWECVMNLFICLFIDVSLTCDLYFLSYDLIYSPYPYRQPWRLMLISFYPEPFRIYASLFITPLWHHPQFRRTAAHYAHLLLLAR